MENKVIEILSGINEETLSYVGDDLFEDGILDSLEMMELITQIERQFLIEVPGELIIPENFKSVKSIVSLIEELRM